MFFSSCFHISLPFYQIHTAPATGKRKIRRFLSEIFDTKRRIRFSYWKPEVTRAMIKKSFFRFGKQCKCGHTFAFCYLASSASVMTL
jgi:hypothetical protein